MLVLLSIYTSHVKIKNKVNRNHDELVGANLRTPISLWKKNKLTSVQASVVV